MIPAELVEQCVKSARARLTDEIEARAGQPFELADQQMAIQGPIVDLIHAENRQRLAKGETALTLEEQDALRSQILAELFGIAPPIERLLSIDGIEEIVINGCDDVRLIHADGTVTHEPPVATSDADLIRLLQALAARGGNLEKSFTPATPFLDLQLHDGSRLAAAAWVTPRPYVAIRRHLLIDGDLGELVNRGVFDPGTATFLRAAVRARMNILVAGGQGVGKTTVMRALLHACDRDERLIVLEQEPELHLDHNKARHGQILNFWERSANTEGQGAITLADLAKAIKRFRPERIVVGEVRGPEVIDMLEAMSQGIAGGMCTIHAESSAGVFTRLPVYARLGQGSELRTDDVLALAALGLDLVLFLSRTPDGTRVLSEIRHVEGFDRHAGTPVTNPWFVPGPDGRARRNHMAPIPPEILDRLDGYRPELHDDGGVA